MIAKHVAMQSVKRSDFAGLVKYIINDLNKNERVGHLTVTNCQSDSLDVAIIEVLNTQAQNTRATSDKTYHLIVSFRAGEQPLAATLTAIEARICDALGYGEHQRVSAVHHDTDNLHVHIAINKIHPTRLTIHNPYYDHTTLGQLCEMLEREFGLEQDNHQAHKSGAENRAADMERHAGVESLLGWIKRECIDQIVGAQSWTELHQVMRANGLVLHERGNGLVITAEDGTTVKASSIGRGYSKNKLEARLGSFEPMPERQGDDKAVRQYEKKPLRLTGNTGINTLELYARYKNAQQDASASRTALWAKAREHKNRAIEAAKRSARLKRAAIKLIQDAGTGKKLLYALTSKTLKDDIGKIQQQYFKQRQAIYDKYRRRAWADWLRAKAIDGDQEALKELRARDAACALRANRKGNTVTGNGRQKPAQIQFKQDSITKKGTIIYRVGATIVRDDGDKLTVSRGADQDGLQAALRMALQRYGTHISIGGSTAFKEQIAHAAAVAQCPITFDDAALERRHQELLLAATIKENQHDQTFQADQSEQRRSAGSSVIRSGTAAAGTTGAARAGRVGKHNVGRIGRKPPPQSQNRLRRLSELGVVCNSGGSEVLLPRDVPGHLEQQGSAADNGLRRGVSGTGRINAALAAADKYILEREQKRCKGFDIPKHIHYHEVIDPTTFAGTRQVDGQTLALLRYGDEVMVLPIDAATARRMQRAAIGDFVTVTDLGVIKTKGRSR